MPKSMVSSARAKSDSFRTTIPKAICQELDLTSGDVLNWSVEKRADKKIIVVRKLQ